MAFNKERANQLTFNCFKKLLHRSMDNQLSNILGLSELVYSQTIAMLSRSLVQEFMTAKCTLTFVVHLAGFRDAGIMLE